MRLSIDILAYSPLPPWRGSMINADEVHRYYADRGLTDALEAMCGASIRCRWPSRPLLPKYACCIRITMRPNSSQTHLHRRWHELTHRFNTPIRRFNKPNREAQVGQHRMNPPQWRHAQIKKEKPAENTPSSWGYPGCTHDPAQCVPSRRLI